MKWVLWCVVASSACASDRGNPRVTAVSPSVAPVLATVPITVLGENFEPTVNVDFAAGNDGVNAVFRVWLGATELSEVLYVDAETVRARVPGSLAVGAHDLRLLDPSGREAVLVGAFTVEEGQCGTTSPASDICANWHPAFDAWQYRKPIVISSRSPATVLSDFPVLVSLTDADVQARALGSGFDIVFASESGVRLEHQLEHYDGTTGELVAWVVLPTLDTASDTLLYLYYGESGASTDPSVTTVWRNGFLAVWHLDESGAGGAGEYADATGNGHAGTGGGGASNGAPTRVAAQIGAGQDFDGVDDYIGSTSQLLNGRSALTASMWVYLRSNDNVVRPGLFGQDGALECGFYWTDRINLWAPGIVTNCPGKGVISLCTPDFGFNTWFQLTASWDGSEIVLYIDSVEKHRIPLTELGSSTAEFNIGGYIFGETNHLDAIVDEVRLATVPRSADWVAIEYANQLDPGAFHTVGVEELHP